MILSMDKAIHNKNHFIDAFYSAFDSRDIRYFEEFILVQ